MLCIQGSEPHKELLYIKTIKEKARVIFSVSTYSSQLSAKIIQ